VGLRSHNTTKQRRADSGSGARKPALTTNPEWAGPMAGVILTLPIGIVWLSMHAPSDRKVSTGPFGGDLPSDENLLCSHQHRAVGCAHFLE
jgi:hypothetical protein